MCRAPKYPLAQMCLRLSVGLCWVLVFCIVLPPPSLNVVPGLVNVLLLYNTFRVLRPALDVVSSPTWKSEPKSAAASEKSFFSPPSPPTKAIPRPLPPLPISIVARDASYRFPAEPPRTREWTHHRSPSSVSSTASRQRLLPIHGQTASEGSLNSLYNHKPLQADNPISEINLVLVAGPGPRLRPRGDHLRANPQCSPRHPGASGSKGLPRVPGRNRFPADRMLSPNNNGALMTNVKAKAFTSLIPPAPTATDHSHTSSKLSIINMYSDSDAIRPERFGTDIHPPLPMNIGYGGPAAQNSWPERGTAPNPPKELRAGLLRAPSMPSSVTNSTSSLTWASVWSSSRF